MMHYTFELYLMTDDAYLKITLIEKLITPVKDTPFVKNADVFFVRISPQ